MSFSNLYLHSFSREKKKISDGVYQIRNYEYDKAGRVKSILESADKRGTGKTFTKTIFDYDKNGNLTQIITPTGNKILRTYDLADRLKEEQHIEKNGYIKNKITYTYDKAGNIVAVTDANGVKTSYSYDWLNRQIQTVGAIGDTQITLYDKNGNIIKQITPNEYERIKAAIKSKAKTNLVSDSEKLNNSRINSLGINDKMTYNLKPDSQKTSDINPESIALENLKMNNTKIKRTGLESYGYTYKYDKIGRMTSVISPDQTLLRELTYNSYGEVIKETIGNKKYTQLEYDLLGRRTKVITPGGSSQTYEYDIWGNITAIEEGRGNKTCYKLDAWGKILSIKKADESIESYEYDAAGNMITATDGLGHTTHFKYNCINQLEEKIDQAGKSQIYLYDEEGRLKETIDRNKNHVLFGYNMYGDLTSKRHLESNLQEIYQYTKEGRLQAAIAGGMRYDYTYDKAGRLHQKKASGRTLLAYKYDSNGNRIRQTDFTGKTVAYTYDLQDRLQAIQELDGKNIENIIEEHTNQMLETSSKETINQILELSSKKHTNQISEMSSKEKVNQMPKVSLKENLKVIYEYNLDGTRKAQRIGNDIFTEYEYDDDMNLIRQATKVRDNYLADNSYWYDSNGNCVEKKQKYGKNLIGTTTYTYDRQNQLTAIQYPTYREELYYDRAGNRTRRKTNNIEEIYRYDERNRLIEHTIKSMTQRSTTNNNKIESNINNNNISINNIPDFTASNSTATSQAVNDRTSDITVMPVVDMRANTLSIDKDINTNKIIKYSYDEQGNLIRDDKATYNYDAFNRMIKVERLDGNIQKNRYDAEGLRYEVEENERLLSYLYSGREVVVQTEEKEKKVVRYIRGYELISSNSDKARTYYHYVSDERGSITHIIDSGTNEVKNCYEYDSFGNLLTKEETIENRFLYTGEQLDPLTGQYYLRARYYNPVIGRFTQEDTYYGDGLNLYTYCANNPIAYIDPNGHESKGSKDKLDSNQQAILDLAKETVDSKGKIDGSDVRTLNDWADEYVLPQSSRNELNDIIQRSKGGSKSSTPGFDNWLNKGASDNKVYFGMKDGEAKYTGITKQSKNARLNQHNNAGKGFDDLDIQYDGLTRNQARAIEQYFIENGPNDLNKINSIGQNNKYYKDALTWAKQYLGIKE